MATISSHVLNSVDGTHAGGVRVQCWRILDSGARESVFDVRSGDCLLYTSDAADE